MPARLVHELVRRLIGSMIEDVIGEQRAAARRRWRRRSPTRSAPPAAPMVAFSPAMADGRARHQGVPLYATCTATRASIGVMDDAEDVVRELFARYFVPTAATCRPSGAHGLDAPTTRTGAPASPISSPA